MQAWLLAYTGDPAEFSNADERQLLQRQGLSSNLLLDGNNYSNGYVDDYRHGYGESDFGYSDANLAEDDLSTASEILAVGMTPM